MSQETWAVRTALFTEEDSAVLAQALQVAVELADVPVEAVGKGAVVLGWVLHLAPHQFEAAWVKTR